MSYPITQNLIAGLPKTAYRNGVGAYEGVVAHATATYNDTAEAERNYEAGHWQNAFVHFFVDDISIVQVADTNYLAWGAGAIVNPRYVQVELCQSYDATKFANAYARYIWLLAKILFDKKLGVTADKTFFGHDDIRRIYGGTTHTDPYAYLASHGVSKDKLITDVTAQYNEMVAAAAPKPAIAPTQYTVKSGDTLWGIATDHNLTVAQLQSYNVGKDLDPLQVGEVLNLVAPAPVVIGTLTINIEGVNVHQSASLSATVIDTLSKGFVAKVYSYANGFYGVGSGYVSDKANVTFTKE